MGLLAWIRHVPSPLWEASAWTVSGFEMSNEVPHVSNHSYAAGRPLIIDCSLKINVTSNCTHQCHQCNMQRGTSNRKQRNCWKNTGMHYMKTSWSCKFNQYYGWGDALCRRLNGTFVCETHKPQTVEKIVHQLAGTLVFTKGRCSNVIPPSISHGSKQSALRDQHSQRQVSI